MSDCKRYLFEGLYTAVFEIAEMETCRVTAGIIYYRYNLYKNYFYNKDFLGKTVFQNL